MNPISIPPHISTALQPSRRDCVRFRYGSDPKNLINEKYICYRTLLSRLPNTNVECQPYYLKAGSPLPEHHYGFWITLCRINGMIPDCVSTWTDEDKHYLWMPMANGSYDRAQAFATLCCYRFADAFPGMIWQIVEHVKVGVHFWQAFHYGCLMYSWNAYHNIMPISTERIYTNPSNLSLSLGAQAYFRYPEVRPSHQDDIYRQTSKCGSRFGCLSVNVKTEVLHPAFRELYEVDGRHVNRQEFTNRFCEIRKGLSD